MPKDSKKVWCAIHQKLEPRSTESCHCSSQAPARIVASRKEIFGTMSMFDHVDTSIVPGRTKKKLPETSSQSLSPELPPPVAIDAMPDAGLGIDMDQCLNVEGSGGGTGADDDDDDDVEDE
ncbi:hypothetical protein L208DRAFT_1381885 [Tricholoma matsutake]|nr:hypothetical protein L208DRAFT_1381885 [Tricholoma matsutake 945]